MTRRTNSRDRHAAARAGAGTLTALLLLASAAAMAPQAHAAWPCDANGDDVINDEDTVTVRFAGPSQELIDIGEEATWRIELAGPLPTNCYPDQGSPWIFYRTLSETERDRELLTPGNRIRASIMPAPLKRKRRTLIHNGRRSSQTTVRTPSTPMVRGDNGLVGKLEKGEFPYSHRVNIENDKKVILVRGTARTVYGVEEACNGPLRVRESDGTANITLRTRIPVAFDWAPHLVTIPGTANSGRDFESQTTRVLMRAFEDSKQVTARIIDDNVAEGNETFDVQLFRTGLGPEFINGTCNPTQGVLVGDEFQVVIEDDDATTIDLGPRTRTVEAGSALTFNPRLRRNKGGPGMVAGAFNLSWNMYGITSAVSDNDVRQTQWASETTEADTISVQTHPRAACARPRNQRLLFFFESGSPLAEIEHQSGYKVEVISADIEPDYAKSFRTGSNSTGYTLNHVDLRMLTGCVPNRAKVELWSSANGAPGARITGLTYGNVNGVARYTSGRRLGPNTQYFIVVHVEDNAGIAPASDSTEHADEGALQGWEIGAVTHVRDHGYQHTRYTHQPTPRTPGPWEAAGSSRAGKVRIAIDATTNPGGTMSEGAEVAVTREGSGTVIGPFTATFRFTQDVTGFEQDDITVANGEVQADSLTSTDSRTFSATIIPGGTGTVRISVARDRALSGTLGNKASNVLEVQASTHPASVTLALQGSADFSRTVTVEARFERPSTGLETREVSVSGARSVRSAQSIGDGSRWRISIDPDPRAATLRVSIPAGAAQDASGRGNAASNVLEVSNAQGGAEQTARVKGMWTDVPTAHAGGGRTFEMTFEFEGDVGGLSYRNIRARALQVRGGRVTGARRKNRGSNQGWIVKITPSNDRDVTATLVSSTSERHPLGNRPSATVRGPLRLSVSDAASYEYGSEPPTLDFHVSLNRSAYQEVTVDYETRNGSAHAGEDYTAASGTLTFAVGETSKRVSVPVLDDLVDEGSETLTLRLSNAQGATISDAEGTGTIHNDDPLQEAWLAEFGAAVGTQARDAVSWRLENRGRPGVRLGGRSLFHPGLDAEEPAGRWTAMEESWPALDDPTGIDLRQWLAQSWFNLDTERTPGAATWGAWGRVATQRFESETGAMSLDGRVTSALIGADVESGSLTAGLALSASRGEGTFAGATDTNAETPGGRIESDLASVHPYASWRSTKTLQFRAMAGLGSGTMTIRQDGMDHPLRTDIAMGMGALGARGLLKEATSESPLEIDLETDALWVRTSSESRRTPAGNMEGAEANVQSLRAALGASRAFRLENGGTLAPSLDLALRSDSGDARTGTGIEAGSRIAYRRGRLSVQGEARTLLFHEEDGYREWGASAALTFRPKDSGEGLSITLRPRWGTGAPRSLWEADGGLERTPRLNEDTTQVELRAGYGVIVPGDGTVVTPYVAFEAHGTGTETRRYGARWKLAEETMLEIESTHGPADSDRRSERALGARFRARW